MARYIYDEIKKELFNDDRSKESSAIIIMHMAKVCREKYNCKAPGEIKEEKLDEYKQYVIESITDYFGFCANFTKIALENKEKIEKIVKRLKIKKSKETL